MAFGLWTTLRAKVGPHGGARRAAAAFAWLLALLLSAGGVHAQSLHGQAPPACAKPVYLTFDTGHMGVADLIADVLKKHDVKVTFFGAQERTQQGDGSLGEHWAGWWRARASEGHEFASHTWDHVVWRGDTKAGTHWRMRPTAGPENGRERLWDAREYCAQLKRASDRLQALTGRSPLPLFRAPSGRTSPSLRAAAKACGYRHVGWAPAGFLGDELASETHPNSALLHNALRDIRSGDVLVAHLGIWSRRDPWAPAVLEPLIVGLKARGFCFATLRTHPEYREWVGAPR